MPKPHSDTSADAAVVLDETPAEAEQAIISGLRYLAQEAFAAQLDALARRIETALQRYCTASAVTPVDAVEPRGKRQSKNPRDARQSSVAALAGLLSYAQREAISLRRQNTARLIEAAILSLLMRRSSTTQVLAFQKRQDESTRTRLM